MLFSWIVIVLLECYSVLSIGYVRPGKEIKRTLIDITRNNVISVPDKQFHSADDSSSKHHISIIETVQNTKHLIGRNKNKTQNNFEQSSILDNESPVDSDSSGSGLPSSDTNEEDIKGTKKENTLSKQKTEKANKKQYATDDFRVSSMSQQPMMTPDSGPSIIAPVPNHVTIDNFDEGVHVPWEEPPHEEPHHEVILPHYEEPTYVHHVEPPPPPPPEHVMIPVPIAAPPPPPPPPPPCTVHIPVTIHLKGKLAIKMKHCENCDFSKNIEAIGPLKIAPINGLKDKLTGAVEAQAKKALFESTTTAVKDTQPEKPSSVYSDIQGTKRDVPPTVDMAQVLQYSNGNDINFDQDFFDAKLSTNEMRATKKDLTEEANKRHVVMAKAIKVPDSLVPSAAFKKGVVISLPRGKALLKCVAPVNATESDSAVSKTLEDTASTGIEIPSIQKARQAESVKPVPQAASDTSATLSEMNDVITFSDPKQPHVIKPVSALQQLESAPIEDTNKSSVEDTNKFSSMNLLQPESKLSDKKDSTEPSNSSLSKTNAPHKLTQKFLSMFDKDMLVALYKMAVKDILNELQHQKKAHKKTQILRKQMENLNMERSTLEKQFTGISLSQPSDILRDLRSADDIDDTGDEASVTFLNTHGADITVSPQTSQTSNSTRRVKLVDTYRTVAELTKQTKPSNYSKQKIKSANKQIKPSVVENKNSSTVNAEEATPEEASSALSFYGDLDPTKLMEESPTCIDAMCEKHKQFIKHAGQYFESLDNIALEPYQKFINQKDMTSASMNADTTVNYDSPYNDAVNIEGMKKNDINSWSHKRQTIFDTMADTNPSTSVESVEPDTIVELFGKLPRVPLKITLNPKGPLAKMKKPIEIDLRPPGKGESSSKMVATANSPNVAVHIANKIFKEEVLDAKQEQKLQSVYADIKRRSIVDEKHMKHIYLQPQKVITEKGSPRMRIVVSLPKELTKMMSQNTYQSESRSLGISTPTVQSQPQVLSSSSLLKPISVVGKENEDRLFGSLEEKHKPEIAEYEEKLKKLKEQTNAVMAQYNKLKDPYSDIGKKKTKIGKSSKKHIKKHKIKNDPYADLGSNVATIDKRSDMELHTNTESNSEEMSKSQNNDTTPEKSSDLENTTNEDTSKLLNGGNEKNLEGSSNQNNVSSDNKTIPEDAMQSHGNAASENVDALIEAAMHSPTNTTTNKDEQPKSEGQSSVELLQSFNEKDEKIKKLTEDLAKLQSENAGGKTTKSSDKTTDEGKPKHKVTPTDTGKLTGNATTYEEVSKDPYATMGSSISSIEKRENLPKRRKKLDKRHYRMKARKSHEDNSEKRNLPLQQRDNVSNQSAISLVRHVSKDISQEVTDEPSAPVKDTGGATTGKSNQVQDNPKVKIDTEKPLAEVDKTSMLTAFPKFSEALSKISPETRKKLLHLKPFKFLSNVDTSDIRYKQSGKDPYADMGSEAQSSKRKTVAKMHSKNSRASMTISKRKKIFSTSATKRSETYDPYADLGTSIGLSQNEARSKEKETQTVHVIKSGDKMKDQAPVTNKSENTDVSSNDDDQPQTKKIAKVVPASTRTQSEGELSEPINTIDIDVDPYADLGASANREPQPYTPSKKKKVQLITNSTEKQVANPTNRTNTPPEHKIKKIIDGADSNVEHFIGKLKLPEKPSNEMEAGDLNQSNEMVEHIASLEKTVAGENDLATIERLEGDIAAEKEKAEASEVSHHSLDKYSILQQNVGKEIQGPYTDMGTKKKQILNKRKVVDVNPSIRQLNEPKYVEPLRKLSRSLKYSNLRKTIRLEKALRKHNEEAIRHMIEKHVEHLARRFISVADKRRMLGKTCAPFNPEEMKKLLLNVAKNAENKSLDPYLLIGTVAKKYNVDPCKVTVVKEEEEDQPTMEEGQLRTPNEEESSTKNKKDKKDPYAELGTSVQIADKKREIATAEKKKEIAEKKEPVKDPYEDLGTVSTKSKIEKLKIDSKVNKYNALKRKTILVTNEYKPKTKDST